VKIFTIKEGTTLENRLFSRLFTRSTYNLEEFTTEVLAGVLRSKQAMLDNFVNQVLKIEGSNFGVETQHSQGEVNPDMVFSNKTTLCFLQSKVDTFVRTTQLEKLKNVLNGQSESLDVYLRYCTKHYAHKAIKGINFDQFRWEEVYAFFQTSYSDNPLVKEFINFLEDKDMNQVKELNANDLVAMGALSNTIRKMDLCLDSVASEFTELFDTPSLGIPTQTQERLQDLVKYEQYHMTKAPLLHGGDGQWGWSDIRICFSYSAEETKIMVWYWCGKTHSQYESFKRLFHKHQSMFTSEPDFVVQDEANWFVIAFKKPLTEFEKEVKPLQAVHNWIVEHMRLLKQFSEKTPELAWNLPK
jgi:hypothetical protein